MNVSELFSLTHWVTENIEGAQIATKYQALIGILQQPIQPDQQQPTFEAQKDDLINSVTVVPLDTLTKDQLHYLVRLRIAQAVGPEAIGEIEDVLFRNVIDRATAASKIEVMLNDLTGGIQKSIQIHAGLDEVVVEEEYEAEDMILIRVSFTGNASMSHVTDFKEWGKSWWEIGFGIAMAHGAAPEDVKVVGATNGSIVLELSSDQQIAATIGGIILAGLALAERLLKILIAKEEIKNLRLKSKQIVKEIEKSIEEEKQEGIQRITAEIAKQLKFGDTDGEKYQWLDKAVKNLVNFMELGGEVDLVMPDTKAEGEEDDEALPDYSKLRTTSQEIRLLEQRIKLLKAPEEHEE